MLSNPSTFFNGLRTTKLFGAMLDQSEVDGLNAILSAAAGLDVQSTAYMLATAYWETAHTMQPVKEANWLTPEQQARYFARMYDPTGMRPDVARRLGNTQPGDGAKYCGRGYVQLTGRGNYAKADHELGIASIANPDVMLQPGPAAQAMRRGMAEGWFTGRRLSDYFPRGGGYTQARRIINGMDHASDIADIAQVFETRLSMGGWR